MSDRGPSSRGSTGAGYWPLVAMIAIVVATAGWTTVAVMALNGNSAGQPSPSASDAAAVPDESLDPGAGASDSPIPDLHEAPALEGLLPTTVAGTTMATQSWTGDTLLSDEGTWSQSIATFLTSVGKKPADLTAAQAVDPADSIDQSVGVFQLEGVAVTKLRDALVAAFKGDYPDLAVSTVKLDGTEVTKGDFGPDAINSYWYIKDGRLYDIESSDEATATAILQAIRDGTREVPAPSGTASAAPS